jgi:hypothetical protein
MTVLGAFGQGIRRVAGAPAMLAGISLATLLLALPFGLALRAQIAAHLGESGAADSLAAGVNYDWWQEFSQDATGLGATLTPAVLGFAAPLANLSALVDAEPRPTILAGVVALYLALWAFLVGGVLDRLARGRPTRAHGFFAACGVFFFRFLRLAAMAVPVYYALFAIVHGWLFETLYERMTRELTVERTAFLVRVALYGVFGLLFVAASALFDYAKVRAVVEDRRSMLGALVAAARFVLRRPAGVGGLYLLNGTALLAVLALYAAVAPGAGGTGWSMWAGFLVGQAYLALRVAVKLVGYGAQIAYFQGELAHAGYVAQPPVPPLEPPAAEAMGRAS